MARSLAVWLLLVAAAIGNGALRELAVVPRLGEATSHGVSTVLLAAFIAVVTLVAIGWLAPATLTDAIRIGMLWLALTLAFEFGFGHWIAGDSWRALLDDYNVRSGRIWVLIPLVTALAPAAMARLRGLV